MLSLARTVINPRAVYWCALAFFTGMLVYSICYLCGEYNTLVRWFYSLNDCFYLRNEWTQHFFTPGVKSSGNYYTAIGAVLSLAGIIISWRKIRMYKPDAYPYSPGTGNVLWIVLVLVAAVSLWLWGNSLVKPGFDEVFSAVNASGDHPFHTWSYYMLPNNHVLFNVINGILFRPVADKVFTGRVVSLLAYMALATMVFHWFARTWQHRVQAFLATLVIIAHLPAWGFAFQARGYELYLLAEWAAFISLFQYHETKSKSRLLLHTVAIVTGYATIPSFMYFHGALLCYSLWFQVRNGMDFAYWKYQLAGIGSVFLFYLPVIGFSGLSALAENRYVAKGSQTITAFVPVLYDTILSYLKTVFAGVLSAHYQLSYILFLLPLLLFFSRSRQLSRKAIFFVLLWGVFIGMALVMKRYPFPRNLFGHLSISLALALLVVREACVRFPKIQTATRPLFSLLLVGMLVYFTRDNKKNIDTILYGNNVNADYAVLENGFKPLPLHGTIGCTDANFYFYYFLKQQGYTISKCMQGTEDYLVIGDEEHFPDAAAGHYKQVAKVSNCFIYERLTR